MLFGAMRLGLGLDLGMRGMPRPASSPSPWYAGTNTEMSIADDRVRATRSGPGNPRVIYPVTGLEPGATYRFQTTVYPGTQSGSLYTRISNDPDLASGTYLEVISSFQQEIDETFVAPAGGAVYIGLVAIADSDGQYAETGENFVLSIVE